MKLSRYKILFFLISLILFIIPFFWLKPGEMDIGGDSSRLYFYDPLSYLPNQSLYSVTISALGWENLSFFGMPFFLLLAFLKLFFFTPTLLISAFHGISLSLSFLFCYLIVKELLNNIEQIKDNKDIVEWSAIVSGILYVFSPSEIYDWGYVILTHNQIFLNPMMFYLMLKFFTSGSYKYFSTALIVSFIFAPNFSFIGAPPFFAFYPISFIFLLIYTKFVRNLSIPYKKIIIGTFLFFLIQAFHLIPQIVTSLIPGGHLYTLINSTEGKLDRGLSYFVSLAPNIKVSTDLLGLPQMTLFTLYSFLFFIFPVIIFLGLLLNKSRTYLITAGTFFIYLLFASANITNTWFDFYKKLFYVPGFSMFRNFYGQWSYAFLFYFVLIFGQALAIVLSKIKKNFFKYIIFAFLLILIIINALPFINGSLIHKIHWTSKGVKTIFTMDPDYKKFLDIVRNMPVDGKFLTLPLNDHGYQIIADKYGGAYQGPSTIAYLTGKKDFSGYEVFGDFGGTLIRMVINKDYAGLKHLFAVLNIKYIFYNSDPKIYGDYFPNFPYGYLYKIMPADQDEYKNFISNLGVKEKFNIDNKYYIYEINDDEYLPHIYTAQNIWLWDQKIVDNIYPLSLFPQNNRVVFYYDDLKNDNINEDKFTPLISSRTFPDYYQIKDLLKMLRVPFISQRLSSPVYPFIVWRENNTLSKFKAVDESYIEESIYFLDKRVLELEKWEDEGVPLLGNIKNIDSLSQSWKDLSPWKIYPNAPYNYWEISLARYEKSMNLLINKINSENQSGRDPMVIKTELNEIIKKHKEKLMAIVQGSSHKTIDEQKYLLKLIEDMYSSIDNEQGLYNVFPNKTDYSADNLTPGVYTPLIYKKDIKNFDISKISIQVGDINVSPKDVQTQNNWIEFNPVSISTLPQNISVSVSGNSNLISPLSFKLLEKAENRTDLINFNVDNSYVQGTSGLVWEINGWYPKTEYVLSFDYLSYGKNFNVNLYENEGRKQTQINILSDSIQSYSWKTYRREVGLTVTDPSNYALSAYLHITKGTDDLLSSADQNLKNQNLQIKNLSLVQIINPTIVFRKTVVSDNKKNTLPRIEFTKINPTKYEVTVSGAKNPYMLVLSEDFNKNWKIVDISGNGDSIGSFFLRITAKILNLTAGRFLPDENENRKELVNYFNGSIIQKEYQDQFLNKNTFDTWGKRIVADKSHVFVNDYANAWYIKPEDMNGRSDYNLVIEMQSQTYFYISLLISLLTIVLIIFLFIFSLRKYKK